MDRSAANRKSAPGLFRLSNSLLRPRGKELLLIRPRAARLSADQRSLRVDGKHLHDMATPSDSKFGRNPALPGGRQRLGTRISKSRATSIFLPKRVLSRARFIACFPEFATHGR